MKSILLYVLVVIILYQNHAESAVSNSPAHKHVNQLDFVEKYNHKVYDSSQRRSKIMKRNIPNERSIESDTSVKNASAEEKPSYPGYHETQHVMVIPPKKAQRPHRAIENYGTMNQIDTKDTKLRNDTFGNNAFNNLLTGLYLWQLTHGINASKDYDVYHHYTDHDRRQSRVTIPPTKLTECSEDAKSVCLAGLTPICTTDNQVYCAVNYFDAVNCSSKSNEQYCARAVIPCVGSEDSNCTQPFLIPCFKELSVDLKVLGVKIRYCCAMFGVRKYRSYQHKYATNLNDLVAY